MSPSRTATADVVVVGNTESKNSYSTTTTAIEALRARGVAEHVIRQLALCTAPALIGSWCEHAARHPRMGPGALVHAIRSGTPPPIRRHRLDDERRYLAAIEAWLKRHFPELCDPEPHNDAIVKVLHLHHRYGKGTLTVREHGEAIRAAAAPHHLPDPPTTRNRPEKGAGP